MGSRSNPNGWGIAVDNEPPSPPAPHTMITIYNTGGLPPLHSSMVRYPSVQVRVRGSPHSDGTEVYAKLEAIRNALYNHAVKDGVVDGVWQVSDIDRLGLDDSSRPIYFLNFRFQKEE